MQLPKNTVLIVIWNSPVAETVPLFTERPPFLRVVVVKVQVGPQVRVSTLPESAAPAPPALVILPLTVEAEHLSSSLPAVSTRSAEVPGSRLKSRLAPTASLPAGPVSSSAEALPAPTNAIRAIAATAARPSILMYFMCVSSLIRHGFVSVFVSLDIPSWRSWSDQGFSRQYG